MVINNKKSTLFLVILIFVTLVFFASLVKYFSTVEYFKFFYLKFNIFFGLSTLVLIFGYIFLNKNIQIYLNIFFISILIAILVIELIFHFNSKIVLDDINLRTQKAQELGLEFDKRSKFQFYQDYLRVDSNAVPSIPPNDFFVNYKDIKDKKELYAISGISGQNTIFCNEGGKRTVYFSDRYGFRNNDEFWDKKNIDIILLGDSLAQGACVDDKDTIHEKIIKYTNQTFLNLGYQGHGPLMQLASLKEYGAKKKPSKIIWFYSETNDIDNLIYEYEWEIFKKYLFDDNHTQDLINNQSNIDLIHEKAVNFIYANAETGDRQYKKNRSHNFFKELKSILKIYHVRQFISFFIPRKYSLINEYYSPLKTFEIYEQIIDKAVEISSSWGGEIYFVYYPHATRYFGNIVYPYPLRKYEHMLNMINDKKIKLIDLKKEVFEKHPDKHSLYPLRMSGHPNERGYDLVAKYISKKIMEN